MLLYVKLAFMYPTSIFIVKSLFFATIRLIALFYKGFLAIINDFLPLFLIKNTIFDLYPYKTMDFPIIVFNKTNLPQHILLLYIISKAYHNTYTSNFHISLTNYYCVLCS